MTRRQLLRDMFWQTNAAGTPVSTDPNVVNTWGTWTLATTLALLNPCGRRCKAWLGQGHQPCSGR